MLLRFDRARSGCPVESKTVSGRARSGLFRVDLSGFRAFPDHVARYNFNHCAVGPRKCWLEGLVHQMDEFSRQLRVARTGLGSKSGDATRGGIINWGKSTMWC